MSTVIYMIVLTEILWMIDHVLIISFCNAFLMRMESNTSSYVADIDMLHFVLLMKNRSVLRYIFLIIRTMLKTVGIQNVDSKEFYVLRFMKK